MDNARERRRITGLRRFAIAITLLNLFGHTVLGFEQSWAQPLVALASAYATELLLELVEASLQRRPLRFGGGWRRTIDFLLSAHISGLAVAMLLYANDRWWPMAMAAVTAIGSKAILRTTTADGVRHVFNPSNIGITFTLLVCPWVGIAPPYHFTENLGTAGDLLLPALIVTSGTILNALITRRLPLIASWVLGFAGQACLRALLTDAPLVPMLLPMTGVAFILYTFYMITDPATTPNDTAGQVIFGLSVAATYGLLMSAHIVFGLFFALSGVCAVRGFVCAVTGLRLRRVYGPAGAAAPVWRAQP